MPENTEKHSRKIHPAAYSDDALLAECEIRRGRRSGPGGQHRNKVETAIVITHQPTGVRSEATERRSQHENREVALTRLRISLAIQVRTLWDESLGASKRWQGRCNKGKISVSTRHQDFPALLAEALDVLAACKMDVPSAAEILSVTPSQFVRLLKQEPRALALVNEARRQAGVHPLR